MSITSLSIVPRLSAFPYKDAKIKEILDWLVSLDAVKPTLSDCILGEDQGYAISEGAKRLVDEPQYLPSPSSINGLEVITERQVFDTAENGMDEAICPHCKQNIADESWDFFDEWFSNKSNHLTCPLCNVPTDIHQFKFTPPMGI